MRQSWSDVTEIYNGAGAYRFGMSVDEARHANVDSVEVFVGFSARLPHLRRLVHVSGYRVGGQAPAWIPWSEGRRARTYRAVAAWAASKMESGALLQTRAETLGVRWTIVNPATVIGDSVSGEADHADGGGGPGTSRDRASPHRAAPARPDWQSGR
ncbi:SDR family oxidoreductase [Georgenia yuyongxinii]